MLLFVVVAHFVGVVQFVVYIPFLTLDALDKPFNILFSCRLKTCMVLGGCRDAAEGLDGHD